MSCPDPGYGFLRRDRRRERFLRAKHRMMRRFETSDKLPRVDSRSRSKKVGGEQFVELQRVIGQALFKGISGEALQRRCVSGNAVRPGLRGSRHRGVPGVAEGVVNLSRE